MHSSTKNDLGDPVDGRRALVDRILASPHFSKSPRLSQFLSFIADRAISGKSAEINEQLIGVHVFGRPPAYSSGEDSIVRSQARFLRQRLDDFFAEDGKSEVLRIRIPKGAYVPVFEAVSFGTQSAARGESQAAEVTFETSAPTITPVEDAMVPLAQRSVIPHDPVFAPASWPRRNLYLTLTAAALLLAVSVWGIVLHFKKRNIVDSSHRLWAAFYENGDPPIIVPSDSTLVLLEELTGTSVRLSDYLNAGTLQTRLAPQSNLNVTIGDVFSHQYTSIVDLSLTARIVRLPEAARVSPEIRYARDLRLNDLKTRSAVLIGGARTNPWIELFSSKTSFYVDYDRLTKHNVVYDRAPKSGQPSNLFRSE